MAHNFLKYNYFLILFVWAGIMMSCHDEKIIIESESEDTSEEAVSGDVLTVNVTLDNMGGRAADGNYDNQYEAVENYVDPEKLRVLVFGLNDQFLFESKSRWVKQLQPEDGYSLWSVSIPLSSYGNDKDDNWDWEAIRKELMTHPFKIAIFANRPDREWNMGILRKDKNTGKDNTIGDYIAHGQTWFGSAGPYWGRTNSYVYEGPDKDVKDVFDLHHCQYDPIYHGKNVYTTYDSKFNPYGDKNYNFYGCIAENENNDPARPFMSATSSWVDWGVEDEDGGWIANEKNEIIDYGPGKGINRDEHGWNYRKTRLPSEEYPIPMYGIQKFEPLTEWKKGSTISLSREGDKAISLLRSVVKLELLFPKPASNDKRDVTLFYSNIYARCEPMDTWTPTDQIWVDAKDHDDLCEWNLLKDFRMSVYDAELNGKEEDDVKESRNYYQQRLTELYGIWHLDNKWSFDKYAADGQESYTSALDKHLHDYILDKYSLDIDDEKQKEQAKKNFVRIFNPCMQRNNVVYVEHCKKNCASHATYAHYVVYTGERNINDPSNLGQIWNNGTGNPTVLYWCISNADGKTYSMPIIDYDAVGINDIVKNQVIRTGVFQKSSETDPVGTEKPSNGGMALLSENEKTVKVSGTGMGTYLKAVQCGFTDKELDQNNFNSSTGIYRDFQNFEDPKYWPLPLIRNHVYRLILTGGSNNNAKTRTGESDMNFSVHFEEMHTKDIGFK